MSSWRRLELREPSRTHPAYSQVPPEREVDVLARRNIVVTEESFERNCSLASVVCEGGSVGVRDESTSREGGRRVSRRQRKKEALYSAES